MDRRLQLQEVLEALLGSKAVYFQPPANYAMEYPCFRYERDDVVQEHANNRPYTSTDRYSVTFMSKSASDQTWRAVLALPMASFDRSYPADGIHHTIISIHF